MVFVVSYNMVLNDVGRPLVGAYRLIVEMEMPQNALAGELFNDFLDTACN